MILLWNGLKADCCEVGGGGWPLLAGWLKEPDGGLCCGDGLVFRAGFELGIETIRDDDLDFLLLVGLL